MMEDLNDLNSFNFSDQDFNPDALDLFGEDHLLAFDHPQERQLAFIDQTFAAGASTHDEGLMLDTQLEQGSFGDGGEQYPPIQMGGTFNQYGGTDLWPADAISGRYRLPEHPPFDVFGTWLPSERSDLPLQPFSPAESLFPAMGNAAYHTALRSSAEYPYQVPLDTETYAQKSFNDGSAEGGLNFPPTDLAPNEG